MVNKNIEVMVNNVLNGESKSNALDFIAFLNTNELIVGENNSEVSYNGENVCYIHIDGSDQIPGPWTVWSDDSSVYEQEVASIDKQVKELAWEHANVCENCGGNCSPGMRKIIFGKTFDNICSSTFMFTNPDAKTIECLKNLLMLRMSAV